MYSNTMTAAIGSVGTAAVISGWSAAGLAVAGIAVAVSGVMTVRRLRRKRKA